MKKYKAFYVTIFGDVESTIVEACHPFKVRGLVKANCPLYKRIGSYKSI